MTNPLIPSTGAIHERVQRNFNNIRAAVDTAEADIASAINDFNNQLEAARRAVATAAALLMGNPLATTSQAGAVTQANDLVNDLAQQGQRAAAQGNAQSLDDVTARLAQIAASAPAPASQPAAPAAQPASSAQPPAQPAAPAAGQAGWRPNWWGGAPNGNVNTAPGGDDWPQAVNNGLTVHHTAIGGLANVIGVRIDANGHVHDDVHNADHRVARGNWFWAIVAFVAMVVIGAIVGSLAHWGLFSLATFWWFMLSLLVAGLAAAIPNHRNN